MKQSGARLLVLSISGGCLAASFFYRHLSGCIVVRCHFAGLAQVQVSLTTLGTPYTQTFDTLPASGL